MHYSVLNRATVRVANTRDVSGRVTTKSVKHGLWAKTQSDLSRICALAIFGSVVSLAPMSARAQAPPSVPAEIAALQKQVAALQSAVATLQTSNSALQSQVNTLQTQLAAVQSNKALALGPYVSVVGGLVDGVNGPHIYFTGANIHIVSGLGATDDNGTRSGLGNLIIGYDELFVGQFVNRGGSHNLVIGRWNMFTNAAFGGLVAGESNTISNEAASVSGGVFNTASGLKASVSGGGQNTASGAAACVSGGIFSTASGLVASVSGGFSNTASGQGASVSGGFSNFASGFESSVSGGEANIASGEGASVSGGQRGIAGGQSTVVIGGNGIIDNKNISISPSPPFP